MLVDIDDHKCTDAHLAERNVLLELASKAARIGSLAIDRSTSLVNLSPGCAMILGLPESTLQTSHDNARKLIHPEDIAQLDAARDQALLKKQREFVEHFRIVRADDGEVRWLEVRSLIFYDLSDEPLRLIAVIIDLTDRKRAEDTLHQREGELVEAQRLARIGNWNWNAESDGTVGSDELHRIFGLDPGTRHLPAYREQRGPWYPVDDWIRLKADWRRQKAVEYALDRRNRDATAESPLPSLPGSAISRCRAV
jgi:PAS domain S-box-containing protein